MPQDPMPQDPMRQDTLRSFLLEDFGNQATQLMAGEALQGSAELIV